MARPKGSAPVLVGRRRRALMLLDEGLSMHEVARRVGCEASSVMRWRDTRHRKGDGVFEVGTSPGRPQKLSAKQHQMLIRRLLKGPMAYGFSTELWTCSRIAALIEQEFGVRYHRDHIGRLMRQLGWSYQRPQRRAVERDDEAIEQGKKKRWPQVKERYRTVCR
jgi:transposase